MQRQFPALRGLATILVALNHAIVVGTVIPRGWGYPAVEGWAAMLLTVLQALGSAFAVPTFLFISGCFLAYAARPKLSYKVVGSGVRLILWPYLLWSLLFYLLVYVGRGEQYSLLGYLKNLLVGYPFNFVPLIVFFYLVAPALVALGRRFGWLLLGAIGAYQLFLLNLTYPGILGVRFPAELGVLVPPVLGRTLATWGIYFPAGMIFYLNAPRIVARLVSYRRWLALATVTVFALGFVPQFELARHLAAIPFLGLCVALTREAIPAARRLEAIGKGAYGVYLSNLSVVYAGLLLIRILAPELIGWWAALLPILFALALLVPLGLLNALGRSPARGAARYLFG